MDVINALNLASEKLEQNDPVFADRVETVLAILRCSGCIPFLRIKVNGTLHRQVAAALIVAHDLGETLDVRSRHTGNFHFYGSSTVVLSYFDKMVKQGLLLSSEPNAKGRLKLGHLLTAYMAGHPKALLG